SLALRAFLLPLPSREGMHAGALPDALAQCRLEIGRAAVLAQEIAEGFVGEPLEVHPTVVRNQVERVPRRVVELHALARHGDDPHLWRISLSANHYPLRRDMRYAATARGRIGAVASNRCPSRRQKAGSSRRSAITSVRSLSTSLKRPRTSLS